MQRLFRERPDAIANTLRIAEQCAFNLSSDLGYTLPDPQVPEGYTAEGFLRRLCMEAAQRRYGAVSTQVRERLEEELRLIRRRRLAGFLLLYREIVLLAQTIMQEKGMTDPGGTPGGASAGQGPRLLRRPAGGLPHRHQPRRPAPVGPDPGAVHLRGHDHAAGHRPRLPKGHTGRADSAGARALRAGVRRPHRAPSPPTR